MKTYHGNQTCPYGLYLSVGGFDARYVGADGEPMNGKPGHQYFRLPGALLILASPVIGGIFVLTFPLIVLVLTAGLTVYSIGRLFVAMASKIPHLVVNRYEPSMAYLAKPKKDDPAQKEEVKKDESKKN